MEQSRFPRPAGAHDANKLPALFGDVDILKTRAATFEMVEQVLCSQRYRGAVLFCQKLAHDVAIVDRFDLASTDCAAGRQHIYLPAAQRNTVQVQRGYTEVFDKVRLNVLKPEDCDEPCEVLRRNPGAGMGLIP